MISGTSKKAKNQQEQSLYFAFKDQDVEKSTLGKELYNIICQPNTELLTKMNARINDLILLGADTTYIGDNGTIVQWLIRHRKPALLEKVLAANPNKNKIIPEIPLSETEPFRLAADEIRRGGGIFDDEEAPAENLEMYNILIKYYDDSPIQAMINECIIRMFTLISVKIRKHSSGKPLLILFGEDHKSLFTSLAECVAIIAAEQAGVTTYFREEDVKRLKNFNETLIELETKGHIEGFWRPYLTTRKLMKKLKLQIIPADLACDGSADYFNTDNGPVGVASEDGLRYRNKIMANKYRKASGNIFAEVGSSHLYGLCIEEKLSDDFEVLALDSAKTKEYSNEQISKDYSKSCFSYRTTCPSVIQLRKEFGYIEDFVKAINPHNLVDYIIEVLMPQDNRIERTRKRITPVE